MNPRLSFLRAGACPELRRRVSPWWILLLAIPAQAQQIHFRDVTAQLALVLAFVQVADAGRFHQTAERTPNSSILGDLKPVRGDAEVGVRAKIGGDLGSPRFIDIDLCGFQGRVCGFELILNLLPTERGLRRERSKLRSRDDNHYSRKPPMLA